MKKRLLNSFTSIEIKHLLISVLVLTFIFGFNDKSETFVASSWVGNLIRVFILVVITLLFHELAHKMTARYYNTRSEHRVWMIEKFGFKRKATFEKIRFGKKHLTSFPAGIFLGIIITLISYGQIFFAAVSTFVLKDDSVHRLGRKYSSTTHYEESMIAIVGLIANLFLLFIFKLMGIQQGMLINTWFIEGCLLPFPELSGSKIFFSSIPNYIFTVIAIAICLILVPFLSIFWTSILAISTGIFLAVFYLTNYSGYRCYTIESFLSKQY